MLKFFKLMMTVAVFAMTASPAHTSVIENGYAINPNKSLTSTNSVKIRCFIGEDDFMLSAAAVLNIKSTGEIFRKKDVALTTGHGLPIENLEKLEQCFVYGPTGRAYKIRAVRAAPDYVPGTTSDWALILFDRIRDKQMVRYSVADNLTEIDFVELASAKTKVQFSTARGLQINGQSCQLVPGHHANLSSDHLTGVVAHSCRAIAGQSGSPVSVSIGDEEILLGIHLGKVFTLPIRNVTTKAQWFGYMRVIDRSLLTTFETMIDDLDKEF